MKRVLANRGDLVTYFGSEEGKHYRGSMQSVEPIKEHIRYLDQKVNEAPAVGNPNGWRYAGSIPMNLLVEWTTKTRTPMDVFARDEGGARQKFLKWLRVEHPGLFPRAAASARPTITVPVTYRKRQPS